MKLMKLAVAMAAFAWGSAYAFHDGGVAYCDGCHVMHNASNGDAQTTKGGQPARSDKTNPFLLQGSDQSSTCLICHSKVAGKNASSYQMADFTASAGAAPATRTPGGDFGYLLKSYSWTTSYFAPGTSPGDRHGHNIQAKDFSLSSIDNQQSRIVAMSFCEPRSWTRVLSS